MVGEGVKKYISKAAKRDVGEKMCVDYICRQFSGIEHNLLHASQESTTAYSVVVTLTGKPFRGYKLHMAGAIVQSPCVILEIIF